MGGPYGLKREPSQKKTLLFGAGGEGAQAWGADPASDALHAACFAPVVLWHFFFLSALRNFSESAGGSADRDYRGKWSRRSSGESFLRFVPAHF